MSDNLELLHQQALSDIENANDLETLSNVRNTYLSKKSPLMAMMSKMKELQGDEKIAFGQKINAIKNELTVKLEEKKTTLEAIKLQEKLEKEVIDITLPGVNYDMGGKNPFRIIEDEMIDIFTSMGYEIAEGPEVEDDNHVYSLLNFAPEHPARDMQDTFFIEKEIGVQKPSDILLRSHTSSVQTRVMLSQEPPIRVLCPGRVYRNEAISARAHCFFHQVEGLYIDKNVSFADLKEVLLYFAKEMFGPETQIRLRPSYFPFTEPSAEMDISCDLCGGKGCSFCKGTGWVEILGCGMVDPNVLESCGIDSKVYTGYAFGLGVERITNLKYRVKDLRLFSENDVRFLQQFEGC